MRRYCLPLARLCCAATQELMESILSHEQNVADKSALYAGVLNWHAHDPQRHDAPFEALLSTFALRSLACRS